MEMSVFLLAFSIVVAAVLAVNDVEEWSEFKLKYEKSYVNSFEENKRKSIYFINRKYIEEHNKKYEAGESTYKMKINNFGDMSAEEYLDLMIKPRKKFNNTSKPNLQFDEFVIPDNTTVPDCINWVTKGAVTPVRNQILKSCGSCYAFACVGALEGQYFIKRRILKQLSVQEIIDCTELEYKNHGCAGGHEASGFQYVADQGGISTEEEYSYTASEGQCRKVSKDKKKWPDKAVGYLEFADEETIKLALARIGPLASSMDAKQYEFRFYSEGIYQHPDCEINPNLLNHSILVVGYCKDAQGREYILAKNSFGTDWGENGYFKLFIQKVQSCGASIFLSYPNL